MSSNYQTPTFAAAVSADEIDTLLNTARQDATQIAERIEAARGEQRDVLRALQLAHEGYTTRLENLLGSLGDESPAEHKPAATTNETLAQMMARRFRK
jgi:uncharacterized protein YciW